jgi:HD-GYP domain-containing protein (c-di-GMP phosphodiesterase class II)
MLIFQQSGQVWTPEDQQRLTDFGVHELYIKFEDEIQWQTWMSERMNQFLTDPRFSEDQKASVIYQTSVSAIETFFDDPTSVDAAAKSVLFVRHCVDYLASDKNAFHSLFNSSSQALLEKAHGIHCAAYAVTLAKHLGYDDEKELFSLGLGAVLHDIGKTRIKKSILEKEGPLDESEWIEIRKHPRYGYQMTEKFKDIPDLARLIILQHHERADGSGYPEHLTRTIHPFSSIVAIADVFDSMTSHRPYKAQSPSFKTMLELLSTQSGRLNQKMLIAFIEMMKK